ncbi:ATP-dependent helicase [Cyanobacterium stanieri LEGE 03274]|uniref:DNA 3'-5' helicase n=1 Tax=Cyanobacterium stanieri LEGE 03274 TaxID=1828756 RepID=A0ABR9V567_9CHRO|nr:ATP-dependent helicase [Cyanobacterium stanieri]MBE9223022.1 ATP-dependent helicase [Cyanobacterium stanieri LEGE 03274]
MEQKLAKLIQQLRPGQDILGNWQKGEMAVAAVPGAGKSHSLAVAAAVTIAREKLNLRRQLIIVTYTRSATASIKQKVEKNLHYLGLPPVGFSVQTIHGLALNIASRYPELSGLNLSHSNLVSLNANHRLMKDAVNRWIRENPSLYQMLVEGRQSFDGEESERLRREGIIRQELLPSLASTVIGEAKCSGKSWQDLSNYIDYSRDEYQIMAIASGLYQIYQQLMMEKNFIDYNDMILGALKVLQNQEARKIWQQQTHAVFEDEAQDSSPLQVELLEILARDDEHSHLEPNLVRVGDPNQAINSTFTSADPIYFNWFCDLCATKNSLATIAQAGRSTQVIIDVANQTLDFINNNANHQTLKFQKNNPDYNHSLELPFREQYIKPVTQNIHQTNINPLPFERGLELNLSDNIYDTVRAIGKKIEDIFVDQESKQNTNLAILVREKSQGKFIQSHLQYLQENYGINVITIDSNSNSSELPQEILKILQFIDRPHSPEYFHNIIDILHKRGIVNISRELIDINYPEKILYPTELDKDDNDNLEQIRRTILKLLNAKKELVHYQLIPYLAMNLNYSKAELATTHKLSEKIDREIVGRSSLKTIISTLITIINSENFEAVEILDDNDNPENIYTKCGQVTIMTMHKSKGLDWDYVFLPFVNDNIIPGNPYIPKKQSFLGEFNFSEVAKGQLRYLIHQEKLHGKISKSLSIKEAWIEAQKLQEYEEYRLLYVAMTRAKRLLWMSAEKKAPFRWSFFQDNNDINSLSNSSPCFVFNHLLKIYNNAP